MTMPLIDMLVSSVGLPAGSTDCAIQAQPAQPTLQQTAIDAFQAAMGEETAAGSVFAPVTQADARPRAAHAPEVPLTPVPRGGDAGSTFQQAGELTAVRTAESHLDAVVPQAPEAPAARVANPQAAADPNAVMVRQGQPPLRDDASRDTTDSIQPPLRDADAILQTQGIQVSLSRLAAVEHKDTTERLETDSPKLVIVETKSSPHPVEASSTDCLASAAFDIPAGSNISTQPATTSTPAIAASAEPVSPVYDTLKQADEEKLQLSFVRIEAPDAPAPQPVAAMETQPEAAPRTEETAPAPTPAAPAAPTSDAPVPQRSAEMSAPSTQTVASLETQPEAAPRMVEAAQSSTPDAPAPQRAADMPTPSPQPAAAMETLPPAAPRTDETAPGPTPAASAPHVLATGAPAVPSTDFAAREASVFQSDGAYAHSFQGKEQAVASASQETIVNPPLADDDEMALAIADGTSKPSTGKAGLRKLPPSTEAAPQAEALTANGYSPLVQPGQAQPLVTPNQELSAVSARIVETVERVKQVTSAAEAFSQAAGAVAESLLVSPQLMRTREGEIDIQLKKDVLDGSRLSIAVAGDTMNVSFTPGTTDVGVFLNQILPRLEEHLNLHVSNYRVCVSVKKQKKS